MQKEDTQFRREQSKFSLPTVLYRYFRLSRFYLLVISIFFTGNALFAHEPLFGVGPRTIWKGGFGFVVGVEQQALPVGNHRALGYHTIYGITEDWVVSLEGHQPLQADRGLFRSVENLLVQTKYRFFQHDVFGGVYHAAVLGGIDRPLDSSEEEAETEGGNATHGTKPTGYIGGASAAYEGRHWMYWGTGRYRVNITPAAQVQPGNVFLFDLALGFRPVLTGFYDPDVVLMAEVNGQVSGRKQVDGTPVRGSGGSRLLMGFGAWITWRNWAVRPGVQIPVVSSNAGDQFNYQTVVEIEIHI